MKPHQDQVFEALATKEGLATWWGPEVDGESTVGCTLGFRFGNPEPAAVMQVVSLVPTERVEWRCVKGPDEWLDTKVTFDLKTIASATDRRIGSPTGRPAGASQPDLNDG